MSQPDGFYTYSIIIHTDEKGVLWEGEINARPIQGPEGIPGLEFARHEVPKELAQVLRDNPVVKIEWSEAWEIIDEEEPKQLEEGS